MYVERRQEIFLLLDFTNIKLSPEPNLVCILLISSMRATCLLHSRCLDIVIITRGEEYKLRSSPLRNLPQPAVAVTTNRHTYQSGEYRTKRKILVAGTPNASISAPILYTYRKATAHNGRLPRRVCDSECLTTRI
jgi:hypothetical protein